MAWRDLDVGLLRTFVAVADGAGIAQAAERVSRTPAAVSQQMQKLEALLDCPLFVKQGRHKRLSEQGVRLLDYARRILALNDEACEAMTRDVFDRPVRLGACADAVDSLLPEYLALSAQTYPGLRVDVRVARSRWLAGALQRGDIDLLIDIEDLVQFPRVALRTSPVVWIAGARLHRQHALPLPLVLIEAPCAFRRMAVDRLEQHKLPWRTAFETTTLAGVRAALRAGLGITPRTIEMLTPDLKVVGEAFGLPMLPSATYYLYTRAGEASAGVRKLHELFVPQ